MLWAELDAYLYWHRCRAHPERYQACRHTGGATKQFELVINLRPPGAWSHLPAYASGPCRRSDRIATLFAAVRMSAFGTKRTSRPSRLMSAFGGKADIAILGLMSAFDPKRTSASISCCSREAGSAYQSTRLNRTMRVLSLGAGMRRRDLSRYLEARRRLGRTLRVRNSPSRSSVFQRHLGRETGAHLPNFGKA